MSDRKKITNKIQTAVLAFFIIFMPLGSWYYLQSGLSYNKGLMSELRDYGKVPAFNMLTQENDTFTNADLHGKITVANFYDPKNDSLKRSFDYANTLLGQFKSQKDFYFLFFNLKNDNAFKQNEIEDKRAFFLSGDEGQMTQLLTSGFKIPILENRELGDSISFETGVSALPPAYPYFVLIDSSLTIRNYYSIENKASMDRLVEHLAIILPREIKSKAELRPKKEK